LEQPSLDVEVQAAARNAGVIYRFDFARPRI
jgi:hypothetical protein